MSKQDTINCEEAIKQLFEYIDNELNAHKHEQMEDHLAKCRSCYSRLEFEKRLHNHITQATKQKAPEALQNKLKLLIQKL